MIFDVCPPRQVLKSVLSGQQQSNKPEVLITIDDGCVSFQLILGLVEKYRMPVVLFVPVGLCLGNDHLDGVRSRCLRLFQETQTPNRDPDVPAMPSEFFELVLASPEKEVRELEQKLRRMPHRPDPISTRMLYGAAELRKLASHPLITLASHSMSHQALGNLPGSWLNWEITKSIEHVVALGGNRDLFAYPYGNPGSVDDRCTTTLAEAGSKCAFTTLCYRISGGCDRYRLGRSAMFNDSSSHYVIGVAAGALEWYDIVRYGKRLRDSCTRPSQTTRTGYE
jgi:peptidoglycan/xylan/chitin deacetylase (PgdA/CDA1 family)